MVLLLEATLCKNKTKQKTNPNNKQLFYWWTLLPPAMPRGSGWREETKTRSGSAVTVAVETGTQCLQKFFIPTVLGWQTYLCSSFIFYSLLHSWPNLSCLNLNCLKLAWCSDKGLWCSLSESGASFRVQIWRRTSTKSAGISIHGFDLWISEVEDVNQCLACS